MIKIPNKLSPMIFQSIITKLQIHTKMSIILFNYKNISNG